MTSPGRKQISWYRADSRLFQVGGKLKLQSLSTFTALTLAGVLVSGVTPSYAETASNDGPVDGVKPEDALVLPIVPQELRSFAEEISIAFEENENFSAVELDDDRRGITIHWFGNDAALREFTENTPEDFSVTVSPTLNKPGDLRLEIDRLLGEGVVVGAGIDTDASKIIATANPNARQGMRSLSQSEFDIEFEQASAPEPVSRNRDSLGIGGARIDVGGLSTCSTAFAVKKGAATAMVTAAHCGKTGVNVTSGNLAYGKTGARNITHDAMLITGKPGGYQGGYYQNDYYDLPNQGSYQMPVFGSLNPIVNDEICYSGALRGLNCGHIVTDTGYKWSFPEMSGIQGFRTKHARNQLFVGKGDSGGSGIVLTAAPGGVGVMPYAATIISGIQNGVVGKYCDAGTPKDNEGSLCSVTVLGTGIRAAAQAFGYTVILN